MDLSLLAHDAMLRRGLEPEFPEAAIEQAERLPGPAEDATVRDQSNLLWCSIDNDESLDLDQLTVSESRPDGSVRIHIAVADVDALVPKGSPLDHHAQINTTSVYTPTKVFPMLPERLSTDLTSLNTHQDRIALVISYTVGPDGSVSDGEVQPARVNNRAKLTYNGVAEWLEGTGPIPQALAAVEGLDEQLRAQDEAARLLNHRRHEEGALDLETIEARAVLVDGRVAQMRQERKNRARTLIEDFMIAANGVTARYLETLGMPSIRRVVRSPERWDRLEALAKQLGDRLTPDPDAKSLSEFLARRRQADPLRFPDLSLTVVKLMGRGEYVATRPHADGSGHFGLAVKDYVHSTAPNRRYTDLITHRLLKAGMNRRRSPYSEAELDQLAQHCSQQEDAAEKVERQMRKSAAALLLSHRIGERFDAIVTGASPKGTWVRIFDPPAEGKLVRGASGVDVGDRLQVRLRHTDVQQGFIDFER